MTSNGPLRSEKTLSMTRPTYKELEARVRELERQLAEPGNGDGESLRNSLTVSGIYVTWDPSRGTCEFGGLPVAMMWVDTTLAGMMAGVQSMVGEPRFALSLQAQGRASVEADWRVISAFDEFEEGFRAIANVASVAGWGRWELLCLDRKNLRCEFRVHDSWEGRYQKTLKVCWGSAMLAGKLAGYASKLFMTNCWAEQTSFIAAGDKWDSFTVSPSNRDIESEVENLLSTDEATRADMAVALERLRKEILERERMEQALRRSQTLEAVGRLAGGVAHDFNNLLGSLLGCVYAVRLEAGGQAAILEELDRLQALCKRGGALTRQLLAVARREPGQWAPVSIEILFEEVKVLIERALPQTIVFSTSQEADLPPIHVDQSLFCNALFNLALNARDAMPDGGHLTMRALHLRGKGDARAVSIEVSDTGEGMAPEILDRVFEPFFTTKQPGKGHGLGLSTAYGTIKDAGGDITVRSSVGEGTTFRLVLPAWVEAGLEAGSTPTKLSSTHPVTTGKVLVVEDETDLARMVLRALEEHGYQTLHASDGLQALEALQIHGDQIRLVILDLVLPGVSGERVYEMLQLFRPEVPVLIATGRPDQAEAWIPGSPCLMKPFTDQDLLVALEELSVNQFGERKPVGGGA